MGTKERSASLQGKCPWRHLHKPMYVCKMNWASPRWNDKLRRRWLRNLRDACTATIREIDDVMSEGDDQE